MLTTDGLMLFIMSPANSSVRRIYELGGPSKVTTLEYLKLLKGRSVRLQVKVPAWIARLSSHLFDLLHLTPLSYGHYELMRYNNSPTQNDAFELLGRPLRQLGIAADPNDANHSTDRERAVYE